MDQLPENLTTQSRQLCLHPEFISLPIPITDLRFFIAFMIRYPFVMFVSFLATISKTALFRNLMGSDLSLDEFDQ